MLRFIFSIAFLVAMVLTAKPQQTSSSQSNAEETGSLLPKPDWSPHELKVGFNAIRSGRSAFGSDVVTHEIQGVLAMHQLNVVLDMGIENNTYGVDYSYENRGRYFRVGGDWSFVKDKESGNAISLGLRYARAGFNDRLMYTADQGFGPSDFDFENESLNARWMEVTFNLRGKVMADMYMGFTMRWQLMRKINGEGQLETFDVPGFGNTKRQNSTAFDYYIMWRIRLKERQ